MLLTSRSAYWRTDVRLPDPVEPGAGSWPAVSVVVPARDEAAMLPLTLPTLLAQDYPGRFEVVVVDDRSGDATVAVATAIAARSARPVSFRVVPAGERPPGWAGKVWAMRAGLASLPAGTRYVLFTDADIGHPEDSLRRLVAAAEAADLDVVSLMARLRCETRWERLVIPPFIYFFGQLYPFRRVNAPHRGTAAAAGGCLLVRRSALAATGDLTPMRDALIDDVSLARLVKRGARPGGGRIWLGHTEDVRSHRPYPRLAELWDMVARSAYTQLRHSDPLVAVSVVGLLLAYVAPPVAAIGGGARLLRGPRNGAALTAAAGAAGWLAMAGTYLPMVRHYRLPAWWALTLPASAVLYGAMTVDSAVRHHRGRGGAWKGRVSAPAG